MTATGTAPVNPLIAERDPLTLADKLIDDGWARTPSGSREPYAGGGRSNLNAQLGAAYTQLEQARTLARIAETLDGDRTAEELDRLQIIVMDVAGALETLADHGKHLVQLASIAVAVWLVSLAHIALPAWLAITGALLILGDPLVAGVRSAVRRWRAGR